MDTLNTLRTRRDEIDAAIAANAQARGPLAFDALTADNAKARRDLDKNAATTDELRRERESVEAAITEAEARATAARVASEKAEAERRLRELRAWAKQRVAAAAAVDVALKALAEAHTQYRSVDGPNLSQRKARHVDALELQAAIKFYSLHLLHDLDIRAVGHPEPLEAAERRGWLHLLEEDAQCLAA